MLTHVYALFVINNLPILQVLCDGVTIAEANKSPRVTAKIEYGKHYVTRTFSSPSPDHASAQASPQKKKIRIKRIRKTTPETSTNTLTETLCTTTCAEATTAAKRTTIITTTQVEPSVRRSQKYTTNWGRFTTNYKGASVPYNLKLFPKVLEVKHNLTKWWDPRYTEWMNYFTGHTVRTRWIPYTVRIYPFKVFQTQYQLALPGLLNHMIRNYGKLEKETDPPHWMKRKYWELQPQLSEGPPRAYRPHHWYIERNMTCPHPMATNTLTPYTGPPLIEFFDCDNYQHNYHYGYDDSELYSEEARLCEKFGSKGNSDDSDNKRGPRKIVQGNKVYDPDRKSEEEGFSVENLEAMRNLTLLKLEESRKRKNETLLNTVVTKTTKLKRTRKGDVFVNTTLDDEYGAGQHDQRDTEEFESMMVEYMNVDNRQDFYARKQRRRQIRTMCGSLISTIKKKLNTIWWKTFWKLTATTPSRRKRGTTTPWFRVLNTAIDSWY
ncbi:uncharacterized protein LOC103514089 [Diaphorina citri]|uniref:Uncharacterized protein LOC103514089 n=1 Tax=Diaphorina citri TaxID=121845 RepID=A0A3Q0J3E5_DIACI|nr:uncharacterized protein LOC103514089 [Diaphorina citri]